MHNFRERHDSFTTIEIQVLVEKNYLQAKVDIDRNVRTVLELLTQNLIQGNNIIVVEYE